MRNNLGQKEKAGLLDTQTDVKVWDIGTRLFHWLLVILFGASAYSAFQDKFGIYADIHQWSGYGVLTLVSWRLLWGLCGSDTARFTHFIKGPKAIIAYGKGAFKKTPYQWVGHNPLGACSVVAMLVLLLVQAGLGLFSTDDMIFSGPLNGLVSASTAGALTSWHKTIGTLLFWLVGLHVLVILFIRLRSGSNLILPMITGKKKAHAQSDIDTKQLEIDIKSENLTFKSPVLAIAVLAFVAGAYWYFIFQ